MNNTGSGILLAAILWLGFEHGFSWWLMILAILPILTWVYATGSDESKALLRAKTEYYHAKACMLEQDMVDRIERG